MSVSTQATFESGHTDQIHDCQYDYYGRVSAPTDHHCVVPLIPSHPIPCDPGVFSIVSRILPRPRSTRRANVVSRRGPIVCPESVFFFFPRLSFPGAGKNTYEV